MKIIFDVDGVLINTKKYVYEHLLNNHNPKYDCWHEVKQSNYLDVFDDKTPEEVQEIISAAYESSQLYDFEKFDSEIIDYIKELSKENSVYICSIGNVANSINKMIAIYNIFGEDVVQIPVISENQLSVDKSIINMSDCVFIDDTCRVLNNTNAKHKILYTKYHKGQCKSENTACSVSEIKKIISQLL